MRKNRFTATDRGRKGKSAWYVEDTEDNNKFIRSFSLKRDALDCCWLLNKIDRENKRKLKEGYHLPGL